MAMQMPSSRETPGMLWIDVRTGAEGTWVVFVLIKERVSLGPNFFRTKIGEESSTSQPQKDQIIFSQGDLADSVFYIVRGMVKVTFLSREGKKATIAILGAGDFFGEESLTGKVRRTATVTAMIDCKVERLEKAAVTRMLVDEPKFSELFTSYLLLRKLLIEQDLVDQLLNPTEKRLARRLLSMAAPGKAGAAGSILMKISQETLAEMIGTTQSRSLGLIDYSGTLSVRSSLSKLVAHD
jgi:CRP/FNR family cyclic AMP-dependent transcriptional regulator